MHKCWRCGETDIDQLEPLDNGALYCGSCKVVSRPQPRTPAPAPPRRRRDTDT